MDANRTCAHLPQCDGPLKAGASVLCRRKDDDRHTCRMVWGFSDHHG